MKRLLSARWARPLLDELSKADASIASAPTVDLQTLVTEVAGAVAASVVGGSSGAAPPDAAPVDAASGAAAGVASSLPTAGGSNGGEVADAVENETLANAGGEEGTVNMGGDDVANLEDLQDMWQEAYAEASGDASVHDIWAEDTPHDMSEWMSSQQLARE